MFRIFRKKKDAAGQSQGQLQEEQLRPVEQAGEDALEQRLQDSQRQFGQQLKTLLASHEQINEALFDDLETALLTADVGVQASMRIMDALRAAVKNGVINNVSQVLPAVQAELFEIIEPCEQFLAVDASKKPFVILMVGVNGAGKTTTIGKLARRFKDDGLSVMLAAGDTFRAAAVEQLQAWGERNEVPVVAQATGADSAAVIFDALQSAKAKGVDVLIADTAGRLHTQDNLMEELKKIHRVMGRVDRRGAPRGDAGGGRRQRPERPEPGAAVQQGGAPVGHHGDQAGRHRARRRAVCHRRNPESADPLYRRGRVGDQPASL